MCRWRVRRARVQGCEGEGGGPRVHASDRRLTCVCVGVWLMRVVPACLHAECTFAACRAVKARGIRSELHSCMHAELRCVSRAFQERDHWGMPSCGV